MYFWKTEQGKIVMSLPSMSCPTPLAERMGSCLMRWRCDAQNVQVTCTVSKEKRLLTLVKSSRCIKTKWNKKNKGGMVGIKPFKIPELRKKKSTFFFQPFCISALKLPPINSGGLWRNYTKHWVNNNSSLVHHRITWSINLQAIIKACECKLIHCATSICPPHWQHRPAQIREGILQWTTAKNSSQCDD